ncbi:MAG: signal peptidase II [Elusimicrobiales bacterium]|jgi:signal peptidase II
MGIFKHVRETTAQPGLFIRALDPALILAVFFLDRLSKTLVLKYLYPGSEPVLPFFKLTYVENTGVAFGMFRDSNDFFIVFSAVLIAALLVFRRKCSGRGPAVSAGLALVLGGALGNLYDRLAYGFVVDFFDLSFFPAVFNIADSAITAGAVLLTLGMRTGGCETAGSRTL